jgi:hypothetical protein
MSEHTNDTDEGQSENAAYETRDVRLRPLLVFVTGLTAVALAVYLVVFGMVRLFNRQAASRDAQVAPASAGAPPLNAGDEHLPPEPRIQANPSADLRTLRAEEDAVLTTYGWVDRQAGVVRVPIDVAMALVVSEGLAVREASTTPAPASATGRPAPRAADPTATRAVR